MLIRKESVISGAINEMDLDVTQAELNRHVDGELAQDLWPHMPPEDREFLITGALPGEWEALMAGEDFEDCEDHDE